MGELMRCEACQGSGEQPLPYGEFARAPCPDCGGSGISHCCDGIQEQRDPGDETPEAMGCADDCCHPDHGHALLRITFAPHDYLVPQAALDAVAGALAAAERLVGEMKQGKYRAPICDTHDEWRELNDAE